MKLCEIVFEFHHNPTAMTGIDGAPTTPRRARTQRNQQSIPPRMTQDSFAHPFTAF